MAAPRDYNQPQYPQQRIIMSNGPPPVNALVLRPGDPRMGESPVNLETMLRFSVMGRRVRSWADISLD